MVADREATHEGSYLSYGSRSSTLWVLMMVRSRLCAKKSCDSKTGRSFKRAASK